MLGSRSSLNDLVRPQPQRRRNRDAERCRGLWEATSRIGHHQDPLAPPPPKLPPPPEKPPPPPDPPPASPPMSSRTAPTKSHAVLSDDRGKRERRRRRRGCETWGTGGNPSCQRPRASVYIGGRGNPGHSEAMADPRPACVHRDEAEDTGTGEGRICPPPASRRRAARPARRR